MLVDPVINQAVRPVATLFKGALRQTIKKGKKYQIHVIHPQLPEWAMVRRKGELVYGWVHLKNFTTA